MKQLSKQEIQSYVDLWTDEFVKEKFQKGFTHIPTLKELYLFYMQKIAELAIQQGIKDILIPIIIKRQNLIAKYKLIMRY